MYYVVRKRVLFRMELRNKKIMEYTSLLTILVSFYNAEEHIVSCIKDLKAQTNTGFHCILVDDGSTDKSHEYATNEIKGDDRFSFIRQKENSGIGAGREAGIRNVHTRFLTFIDVDDKLEINAVEKIMNAIRVQEADLYMFDYFTKNESGEVRQVSGSAKTVKELFSTNDKRISRVWHKIFRTSLFEEFDFPFLRTNSFAEDLYICIHCFMKSQKTIFIPDAYYYYVCNEHSLVHSRTEKSICDEITVIKKLLAQEKLKQFPEIKAYIQNESFHAFGQLIFPNKKNPFQWNSPHFDEWRNINADRQIFIPPKTHPFVRLYIALIKAHFDFAAKVIWNVLKIQENTN